MASLKRTRTQTATPRQWCKARRTASAQKQIRKWGPTRVLMHSSEVKKYCSEVEGVAVSGKCGCARANDTPVLYYNCSNLVPSLDTISADLSCLTRLVYLSFPI